MSQQEGLNLLVFRPGRRQVRGAGVKAALLRSLEELGERPSSGGLMAALLRAGELECSAADALPAGVPPFATLTDCLAESLLRGSLPGSFPKIKAAAASAPAPDRTHLSTPEGFAYYALHPLAYADVLDKLPELPQTLLVVGIRSIGTTLSAITAAAARLRGRAAARMTVRPAGHPYNRRTEFTSGELDTVREAVSSGASLLVVDEGPGLSGSSLVSVAEALENAGAAPEKIVLICGHEPRLEALCSTNAAERWRRFRHVAVAGEARRPAEAEKFIGAGEWRSLLFHHESDWPDSWTSMERLKYLSISAPRRLFKFAGLGHYGNPVFEREQAVAAAGFGPAPLRETGGFVSYPWREGRPMSSGDLSPGVLARMAEYCAFRLKAFPVDEAAPASLQEMAEHNLAQFALDLPLSLKFERPVIADGRMHPHEWLLTNGGPMLKTDSGSHGDDHFFPGPADIAWDLAGAIVEWRMSPAQADEFLKLYHRASGDHAFSRVQDFIRAYAVFRCAYCSMAARAMHGTAEELRMERAAAGYLAALKNSASGMGRPDPRAVFSLAAAPEL
jgi:hypothetical protein